MAPIGQLPVTSLASTGICVLSQGFRGNRGAAPGGGLVGPVGHMESPMGVASMEARRLRWGLDLAAKATFLPTPSLSGLLHLQPEKTTLH